MLSLTAKYARELSVCVAHHPPTRSHGHGASVLPNPHELSFPTAELEHVPPGIFESCDPFRAVQECQRGLLARLGARPTVQPLGALVPENRALLKIELNDGGQVELDQLRCFACGLLRPLLAGHILHDPNKTADLSVCRQEWCGPHQCPRDVTIGSQETHFVDPPANMCELVLPVAELPTIIRMHTPHQVGETRVGRLQATDVEVALVRKGERSIEVAMEDAILRQAAKDAQVAVV